MRALFCIQSFQRNYDEYDISQRNKDVYLRATMPANDSNHLVNWRWDVNREQPTASIFIIICKDVDLAAKGCKAKRIF